MLSNGVNKKIVYGIGKYKTLSSTTRKSHPRVIAEGDFLEAIHPAFAGDHGF